MRHLLKDKVTLTRSNGDQFPDIQASVQTARIFLADVELPVEKGDVFEQVLPSGLKKTMIVTEAHVPRGHHYEIDYVTD